MPDEVRNETDPDDISQTTQADPGPTEIVATRPDNDWHRVRALEIAAGPLTKNPRSAAEIVADARLFYNFLVGDVDANPSSA
jgi:ABC-type sugar transport system substrate-binding protein